MTVTSDYTSSSQATHFLTGYEKKRDTDQIERLFLKTFKAIHLGGEETPESKLIKHAFSICPNHSACEMRQRISEYEKIKGVLENLSDTELTDLLQSTKEARSGTGGEVSSIEIDKTFVFVKKIPLTEIEKKQLGSTQNIFDLPFFYQYGVGSLGFGVCREIAAHEITTNWVLNGECQNFPLMYHFRIIERPAQEALQDAQELDSYVQYWDGSCSVKERKAAVQSARFDVVVFLESIPTTLHKRISKQETGEADINTIERELLSVTRFMQMRGFLHFDAHFHNILTKNNHVYFADFGLAISSEFDLSQKEQSFLKLHRDYDRSYVVGALAESLAKRDIKEKMPKEKVEQTLDSFFSNVELNIDLHPVALRYRPLAIIMDEFFGKLREVSKSTPYPAEMLAQAWSM